MASPSPNTTPTTLGFSTTMIAGVAVVGAAAVVLAIILTYVFVRRRRQRDTHDQESPKMLQVQTDSSRSYADTQGSQTTNACLIRSVSRHNLTPSVTLPLPMPLPAARPRPPKFSPEPAIHPSGRPMSSVEVVAHHQAAGTMPRPFSPGNLTQRTPTYQAKGHRMSSASASFSFSRASILSAMRPDSPSSSLRSSLGSSRSRLDSGVLRVRHVFAPLLPDELVLRPNEKVTLIQTFEDGWYIVGRKSPFHSPARAKPSGYAFGQGTPADEVEIGAVPSWVFEKRTHGSPKPERPMRNASLGVTLVDPGTIGLGGVREDVISWSNF